MAGDAAECAMVDVAAHALGALGAPERRTVEHHLQACTDCRTRLAGYESVRDLLAYALDPDQPPTHARTALLQRARRPRALRWLEGRRDARRTLVRPFPLLLAVSWVMLAFMLIWNLRLQFGPAAETGVVERLARAPHGRIATLVGAGPAATADGRLYVDEDDENGMAGLAVAGLPQLEAGRVYRIWFVRPDGRRESAGVFIPDTGGRAAVILTVPGPIHQFSGVGISDEPADGSGSPSGAAVLIGTF